MLQIFLLDERFSFVKNAQRHPFPCVEYSYEIFYLFSGALEKGKETQQYIQVQTIKKCRRGISKHTRRINAKHSMRPNIRMIYMEWSGWYLSYVFFWEKRKDVLKNNDNSENCLS